MISHHLDQSIADKKFSPMRQDFTYSFTVLWIARASTSTTRGKGEKFDANIPTFVPTIGGGWGYRGVAPM